jgi:uncharacterized membrane protein
MNDAPLHPMIVHLPLALAMLVPLVALGLAVAIRREALPRGAWALVLGLQVLMVGSGIVAMQTGEADEEIVEAVVPEPAIEAHEEAAELFVWASGALTILFVLGVALPQPSWRTVAMGASVAGSVFVAALAIDVGDAGGDLVYRHGAASVHAGNAAIGDGQARPDAEGEEEEEQEEDDDDD